MKQQSLWFMSLILLLTLVGGAGHIRAADAVVGDGSPESCTEAAFDAALTTASGGGTITFACGPNPHTILFINGKTLPDGVALDGGDLITLSGGGMIKLFTVLGGTAEIRHMTLTQGFAGNGGAIEVSAGAQLTLADMVLSHNTAGNIGGGLYNAGGTTVLLRVALDNNSANYGGGIYNNGVLTLTDVTLADNSATSGGGGLYNNQNATLSNVTVATNSSGDGGGVFNSASGNLIMSNSTVSGNHANYAGGLFNNGTAVLTNVTVATNTSLGGGGGLLHNSGLVPYLELSNVILAQNTGPTTANDQCLFYKAPDNLVYSLWSGTSCGSSTADGNQPDTEALLSPLGFTGTGLPTELTMTHSLLPGSPAEDMGTCTGMLTDQRGVDRPQGGGCDVGAVETIPIPPVYGFTLSGTRTQSGMPGTAVNYTLTLTNTGSITDTINLMLGTTIWPVQLSQSDVMLAAYAHTTITVMVDIPADALGGQVNSVMVTAVSQGDTTQTSNLTLTTLADYQIFLPMVIRP